MNPLAIIAIAIGWTITMTAAAIHALHHGRHRDNDPLDTTAIQPDAIDHELAAMIREAAL